MKKLLFLIIVGCLIFASTSSGTSRIEGKRILIYTKNGEGYVHENIDAGVRAIQEICTQEGILTEVSDDPSIFEPEKLFRFDALFFANTNNEGFDTPEQKKTFQNFCRSGKGFAALHSANATEREWPWYWSLVGGKFVRHAPFQSFDVVVIDPSHPSTASVPQRWTIDDECYYSSHLNPDIHILLAADLTTIEDKEKKVFPGEIFGNLFPLSWCQKFEGGRQWYSALGHDPDFYQDSVFREHIRGGILRVLGVEQITNRE
jgi:type 1 glutamine amidotransferase